MERVSSVKGKSGKGQHNVRVSPGRLVGTEGKVKRNRSQYARVRLALLGITAHENASAG